MRDSITRSLLVLFATALVVSAVANRLSKPNGMTTQARTNADPNPLLANWEGPYGGVPPFDRVQIALFKPALESAMRENLMEVEKIANDSAAPTFENTIMAIERAGQTLDRDTTIYGVWGSTMARPEFQAVHREKGAKLA